MVVYPKAGGVKKKMVNCPYINGVTGCDDCINGCTNPQECLEAMADIDVDEYQRRQNNYI